MFILIFILWQIVNANMKHARLWNHQECITQACHTTSGNLPQNNWSKRKLGMKYRKMQQKQSTIQQFRFSSYDITIQNRINTYGMIRCTYRCMILVCLNLALSGQFQRSPSSKSLSQSPCLHRRMYHRRTCHSFHKTRILCLWNKESFMFRVCFSANKIAK